MPGIIHAFYLISCYFWRQFKWRGKIIWAQTCFQRSGRNLQTLPTKYLTHNTEETSLVNRSQANASIVSIILRFVILLIIDQLVYQETKARVGTMSTCTRKAASDHRNIPGEAKSRNTCLPSISAFCIVSYALAASSGLLNSTKPNLPQFIYSNEKLHVLWLMTSWSIKDS